MNGQVWVDVTKSGGEDRAAQGSARLVGASPGSFPFLPAFMEALVSQECGAGRWMAPSGLLVGTASAPAVLPGAGGRATGIHLSSPLWLRQSEARLPSGIITAHNNCLYGNHLR